MKLYVLCLFLVASSIEAAKILGILHVPVKSHFTIGFSVLKGLADKGHDVTIASPFPSKDKDKNFRDVYLDGLHEIGEDSRNEIFEVASGNPVIMFQNFANFTYMLAATALKSQGMQNLISSGEKFDVIVVDNFENEAFFGLGHIFNSHIVVIASAISDSVNHLTGNIAPYSFVPNVLSTFSDKMTFVQRVVNVMLSFVIHYYINGLILPGQKQLYDEVFENVPPFEDTIRNVSLVLVNSHVLFETPRPYLPNMIPIGGVHIGAPKKLPQDLQALLDNSKQGVILFSLGSNLSGKNLPQSKIDAILQTFGKLPQQVLWKFEDEQLQKKLPKNVQISKWYPQSDILAHPNVKLFITHGGLLSSTEAVYRGVPIIGIPIYGDQFANIAKFVHSGYGLGLFLEDLTEESFSAVIKEVLENDSYRVKINQSSQILQHQPDHPLHRAVFWIEHVAQTNGARHLRSTVIDLSLWEYLLLDIIVFTAVVLGTFIVGIYLVAKTLCGRKEKEEATKKSSRKSKRE